VDAIVHLDVNGGGGVGIHGGGKGCSLRRIHDSSITQIWSNDRTRLIHQRAILVARRIPVGISSGETVRLRRHIQDDGMRARVGALDIDREGGLSDLDRHGGMAARHSDDPATIYEVARWDVQRSFHRAGDRQGHTLTGWRSRASAADLSLNITCQVDRTRWHDEAGVAPLDEAVLPLRVVEGTGSWRARIGLRQAQGLRGGHRRDTPIATGKIWCTGTESSAGVRDCGRSGGNDCEGRTLRRALIGLHGDGQRATGIERLHSGVKGTLNR